MRKGKESNDKSGKSSAKGRNNRSRSRSRRAESKGKSSDSPKEAEFDSSAANDPMWYALNPALLRDAGSLSFNEPLGVYPYHGDHNGVIPGVMALTIVPTVGLSQDSGSAINIAAKNIYSYVRHANSGHANYEVADIMMYLLAMDNLYSYHAFLRRIYGVANVYSQVNRYLPAGIFDAMQIDYTDVLTNLADLRYYINNFAVKIGSLCTPGSMPYFARHMWMYSHIFTDAPTIKSQMYFYTPEVFYKFEPTALDTGGMLTPIKVRQKVDGSTGPLTVQDLMDYGDALVTAVMNDEDMGIISGDILKAFGAESMVKVPLIDTTYSVFPTYSPEVLVQIKNAVALGVPTDDSLPITQNEGFIKQRLEWTRTVPAGNAGFTALNSNHDFMLDMPVDSPDPSLVMVGTRLTYLGLVVDAEGVEKMSLDSYGSEILANIIIPTTAPHSDGFAALMTLTYCTTFDTSQNALRQLCRLHKFDSHPTIAVSSTNTNKYVYFFNDVSNYTMVERSTLRKLHSTALLSEFDVPQMGAYSLTSPTVQK